MFVVKLDSAWLEQVTGNSFTLMIYQGQRKTKELQSGDSSVLNTLLFDVIIGQKQQQLWNVHVPPSGSTRAHMWKVIWMAHVEGAAVAAEKRREDEIFRIQSPRLTHIPQNHNWCTCCCCCYWSDEEFNQIPLSGEGERERERQKVVKRTFKIQPKCSEANKISTPSLPGLSDFNADSLKSVIIDRRAHLKCHNELGIEFLRLGYYWFMQLGEPEIVIPSN